MDNSAVFADLVKKTGLGQQSVGKVLGRSRKVINQWCQGKVKRGVPVWAIEKLQRMVGGYYGQA